MSKDQNIFICHASMHLSVLRWSCIQNYFSLFVLLFLKSIHIICCASFSEWKKTLWQYLITIVTKIWHALRWKRHTFINMITSQLIAIKILQISFYWKWTTSIKIGSVTKDWQAMTLISQKLSLSVFQNST